MTNSVNPSHPFAEPDFPAVTPERIFTQLAADVFSPAYSPVDPAVVVAKHNDVDWLFSIDADLVKVECVLPTELSEEFTGDVLRTLANEFNAQAFDGRALVGSVEGYVELRGDANFVIEAGMNDEQLFHSLNFAVVAAQDALFSTLDGFNELLRNMNDS